MLNPASGVYIHYWPRRLKKLIEKRQISYENITSEEGILLRMNRSIQVEGAFGVP